jgi:hypothetical protein
VDYIWVAITVLIAVFRRHDIGRFVKAPWDWSCPPVRLR